MVKGACPGVTRVPLALITRPTNRDSALVTALSLHRSLPGTVLTQHYQGFLYLLCLQPLFSVFVMVLEVPSLLVRPLDFHLKDLHVNVLITFGLMFCRIGLTFPLVQIFLILHLLGFIHCLMAAMFNAFCSLLAQIASLSPVVQQSSRHG